MGPPAGRENGRKRRRRADGEDDDDYDDEDFVVEEEDCAGELSASSAGEEGEDSDAEYQEDDEEEEEEETPRAKRPVKGGARGGKGRTDPASNSKRGKRHRYEVDDDYEEEPSEDEEPDEDEEVEEYRDETPRQMKVGTWGRKGKKDPAPARPQRHRYEVDDDYEYEVEPDEGEEPDEDEEVEEYQEEVEEYKEEDEEYKEEVEEYKEEDEEYKEEEEEYKEEVEEEEEAPPSPKSLKCADRGHSVEEEEAPPPPMQLSRSHRRKYEEDDTDFEPELDDDEEEVDEDIDFDPEVDDEDEFEDEEEEEFGAARSRKVTVKNPAKRKSVSEDEFEDEEEEEFGSARSRKVTVKNPAKRKSVSKRRSVKKKANKGSKSSKRKRGSAKAKKSASVRRVRKRFVVDDSDQDSEDDDDFIVDDEVEVNRHRRKKARTGTSKQTELEHPSFDEDGIWPNVESETSEFEFVTSDDEPDDAGTAVVEASSVRKGRKKRKSGSESSSDSEFVVSDKELDNLGETEPPKLPLVLATPIRKNPFIRHGENKGKEKEVPEEAGKPICGICLSEEQRTTVQGVLNCCSHYFCFACIMEWSRVESRCPLCKQRFTTITKSSKADLGLALRKAIIKVEERDQVYQPTEEEIRRWLDPYENVVCIECNQGGDDSLMLLCDICDSSAHTYCVGLGREVPEGNWYCGGCRLSDEGPSHAITPSHTVGYQRQSYRNHVDYSPVGFGVAAQNGTFDRSSSMNRRRSFQGIDLNLSPREGPGEHHAESHASTDSVSTPSGRHATVSGRRQIHRYIRILLSRPRTANTRLEDILPSFAPRNGGVTRTELNHHSFRSSSEANTSQIPDGIQNQHNGLPFAPSMHLQNQHNGLPFAPSMPLDGDDFTHIEGVKSNLRNV